MNDKENLLRSFLDAVVSACATQIDDTGKMSITKEEVLGKCRKDNVVMTRCMLANQLRTTGLTYDTIGSFLNRSAQDIRKLCAKEHSFLKCCAYRIAHKQASTACKGILDKMMENIV